MKVNELPLGQRIKEAEECLLHLEQRTEITSSHLEQLAKQHDELTTLVDKLTDYVIRDKRHEVSTPSNS